MADLQKKLYISFEVFAFLVRLVPRSVAGVIGQGLGLLAYYLLPERRKTAVKNVALCPNLPPQIKAESLAKASFANMGLMGAEFIRFYSMSKAEILSRVEIVGREHLDRALKKGKGVVFISAHLGNWELMGMALVLAGYPISPLVKTQKNSFFDQYINEKRRSLGMKPVATGFSLRQVMKALKENRVVNFMMDQNAGKYGVKNEFLGRAASTPRGAAAVARKTGATVIPGYIIRVGPWRHRITILPEVEVINDHQEEDIVSNTNRFSGYIEEMVLTAPEQWMWMHHRWGK